ncbi:MAG: hypothetical protein ACTSWY_15850 [Promethearchaeota archaeon]
MSKRIELLRLDYLFSVIVPCLMAIYLNDLNFFNHLDIIAGFGLYAITGNTLNDMIDAKNPEEKETIERIKGFHWKEIATISIIAFIFGTMLFVRTVIENPINGIIILVIILMVVIYCLKKDFPVFNQILLCVSHVFLPYLIIKIDAMEPGTEAGDIFTLGEWFLMTAFFCFAFMGQIVHEIIDGDSITRFSSRTQQITVIVSSVLTIAMAIITLFTIEIEKSVYFIPFITFPIGVIYAFRHPTRSTKGVKDIGLIFGNIILVYFLVLIFMN